MSKLYVIYGTMNSSKTANLCMSAFNYKSIGKNPLVIKPSFDSRSSSGKITSRIGVEWDCVELHRCDSILDIISYESKRNKIDVVMIDECNFLENHHIDEIINIVDNLNIPVMCYGLKNGSNGKLFDSMARLLFEADKVTEIKSMCSICGERKSTHNLRYIKGCVDYGGIERVIGDIKGDDIKYVSCCRKCYYKALE